MYDNGIKKLRELCRSIGYICAIFLALGVILFFVSCRYDDEEKVAVTGIEFEEERIKIGIGQQVKAKLQILPFEAHSSTGVVYNASVEGFIEIKDQSNDGCVVRALKGGSVVLVARAAGFTAYCEIVIENDLAYANPYIVIPTQVIEVLEGSQRSVQISLFNGMPEDNFLFEWSLEPDKDNITMFPTANTVVVRGDKRGSQRVRVHHPKSEYDGEILVFVLGVDDAPRYITTLKNVIVMESGGSNETFSVALMNGSATDKSGFTFTVVEGAGVVTILSSNESCNVMPSRTGTAVIRVQHPLAEYALDVRVIVVLGDEPVIELDKTLVLLPSNGNDFVTATINGTHREQMLQDFYFEVSDESIVRVTQTNNQFLVEALETGSCVLTVWNRQLSYPREALLIVGSGILRLPDEYYITTSQNVVQLEIGQEMPTQLMMLLVGGNEADGNLFSWVVEDSSIITVESAHGNVSYERSMIRRAAVVNDVFSAVGLITPRKIGQTKITVSHPKSSATGQVLVKVYPRGTFAQMPVLVGYEGIIKLDTTRPDEVIQLRVISGLETNVGTLSWDIENTIHAEVTTNGTGLVNTLHGKVMGNTKLEISGDNLKYPHESIVLVGTTDELANMDYIYTDNVYQTIAVGQSISVQIKNSNGRQELEVSPNYEVSVSDSTRVYATMIKSRLLLQGISEGPVTVEISHPGVLNRVTIRAQVESGDFTIDKPYQITGPDFVGMYFGQEENYQVNMAGASSAELDRIMWKVPESELLRITGNGRSARVQAGTTVGQTNVVVSHAKSVSDKTIVFYVVPTAADLVDKILIGIEKANWLLEIGDDLMIKLITNARPDERAGFTWEVMRKDEQGREVAQDISNPVINCDYNGDSAFIRAMSGGNVFIKVTHPNQVLELKIFISVTDRPQQEKSISVPTIIEMIIGENKVIKADTRGLTDAEKNGIAWSVDNSQIVSVSSDGEQSFIFGKTRGQTYITAKQTALGFEKRILLVCAATYEELANMHIMAAPETYYRIKVGDQRNIVLEYGSAGFPEEEKQHILWSVTQNNVVKLYPNGGKAMFEGLDIGVATITTTHDIAFMPVTVTVEVDKDPVPGDGYKFVYESLKGIALTDPIQTITVSLTPSGASPGQITFENQASYVADVVQEQPGNIFTVRAKQVGQTYLTLKHPLVQDPARILIYTALNDADLATKFPIGLAKTNYLVDVGKKETIRIETASDDAAKLGQITWSLDVNGIASYVFPAAVSTNLHKKEVEITGVKAGNCVFSIMYNGVVAERAYVSVRDGILLDASKKIATESIIGLVSGGAVRRTIVQSNLSDDEVSKLEWTSRNNSIATVEPDVQNRAQANITPGIQGETEIVVSFGRIERHIKVIVCGASIELTEFKAVNFDNRYYQIRRNDEITLTAYHAAKNADVDDEFEDMYENNVVSLEPIGKNKVQVKGVNEGLATVVVWNEECQTDVKVVIEVSNSAPSVTENMDLWYLTTSKTVYALDPDKTTEVTRIGVIAVNFTAGEESGITWTVESGQQYISYYPNGTMCDVAPNGGKGTAILRVSHPKSANYLDITVICSLDAVPTDGSPFVTASDETVRLAVLGEKQVGLGVANVQNVDISRFVAVADNGNVEVSVTGNVLTVKGVKYGQSLITITHSQALQYPKKIVAVVSSDASGIIFLTTTQNFVVIERNGYKAVEVSLVGFEDNDNSHFHWEGDTDADKALVQINASGKSAVITGKEIGTAKIKVWHDYAMYPLYTYVRVSEIGTANPVYITTSNNIVSVKKGNSMMIKADLKNGMAHELSLFSWGTGDRHVVELNSSGDTAMVKGISSGTAGVTISHPAALNTITIIVVVEPEDVGNGIYITTDNLLVEMTPNDSARRIQVRLIGGNPEDIYGFQWVIVDYVSILKNSDGKSRPVINMIASGDQAFVSAYNQENEGEATIRISHPKTAYKLDMKVVIRTTAEVSFAQKNLTMDQYSSQSVVVTAPLGQTILYESSNPRIASVVGTSKVCVIDALQPGQVVITGYNSAGTKSDEMIVRVLAVDTTNLEYIVTDTALVTMSSNSLGIRINGWITSARDSSQGKHLDTRFLQWESKNQGIVRVTGDGGQVLLNPVNPPAGNGETEIHVRYVNSADPESALHPSLKTYIKKIYVKVSMDDTIFAIDKDALVLMEPSGFDFLTCRIDNVVDVDYFNDVVWSAVDPTIVAVEPQLSTGKGLAIVQAKKAGSTSVMATYRGSSRYCTVVVTAQKSIRPDFTNVTIQPGDDPVVLKLYVTPQDEDVVMDIDQWNFADVDVTPKRTDGDLRIYGDGSVITITPKDSEGITIVRFSIWKGNQRDLSCSITINTVKNYGVKWKHKASIRGRPYISTADWNDAVKGSDYRIEYEISPSQDWLVFQFWRGTAVGTFDFDNDQKIVKIRPTSAGNGTAVFRSYREDKEIELPVYFYYDKFDVVIASSVTAPLINDVKHTRVDTPQGAIFIANGETLSFTINDYSNPSNAGIVFGDNGVVSVACGVNGGSGRSLFSPLGELNITPNGLKTINLSMGGQVSRTGGANDQLIGISYLGTIYFNYKYYMGGSVPNVFTKTYLVYCENWRRMIR